MEGAAPAAHVPAPGMEVGVTLRPVMLLPCASSYTASEPAAPPPPVLMCTGVPRGAEAGAGRAAGVLGGRRGGGGRGE